MKATLIASVTATLVATAAWAGDKAVFGTNWLAQGGHGGICEALADGTYEKYGLEIEIQIGGPQMNNRPMLPAGKLDFLMTGNLLLSMDSVRNGIPTIAIASYFEKDPQAIIAHKGQKSGWDDLANAPEILISKDGQFSFWPWMTAAHGFKDETQRPYGHNLAAFLNDEKVVQQAYGTAEPLFAAAAGAEVETYLLADQGWSTYSTTIKARVDMVENNPDLVQPFVDATAIGWYNYLYGDNSAGNAAIIEANPDQTLERLEEEVKQMKSLGIIDSGYQLYVGIGAIAMARAEAFRDLAVEAGIIDAGAVDVVKMATDLFVNKMVDMDLKSSG